MYCEVDKVAQLRERFSLPACGSGILSSALIEDAHRGNLEEIPFRICLEISSGVIFEFGLVAMVAKLFIPHCLLPHFFKERKCREIN